MYEKYNIAARNKIVHTVSQKTSIFRKTSLSMQNTKFLRKQIFVVSRSRTLK
jgi:hypothetical protein